MSDWPSLFGAVGGIIGAVGGTIGAVGGVLGVRAHRRTNELAARTDVRERLEHHERLKPGEPAYVNLERREGHNFATIRLPRSYRALGYAIIDDYGSRRRLNLPALLEANKPYEVQVEHGPPGRERPTAEELLLDLWPGDDWTCACGRRTNPSSDEPHWRWRAPVKAPPPPPGVW
ncbi:hypothetical protein JQS43_22040 [Natronosporangium hydrolyticum]|uniref:Uncharacterized protein n=1 Tax=Natronosporangium hydrolyticum TaxID=2811111 RepID=A0A895Y8V1_9ACTN|nr:hypothetical protein [Natronosporangium hydrolyticum]QSB14174.1 hypothetical protein JQS43_22040 [Natronosporangium hydrolyticum]